MYEEKQNDNAFQDLQREDNNQYAEEMRESEKQNNERYAD